MSENDTLKFENPQERELWEKCILAQMGNSTICRNMETTADSAVLVFRSRRGPGDILNGKEC